MSTRAHVAAKTLREWLEKNQVTAAELARRCSSGPLHFDRKRIGELLACTHIRADLLTEIERVTAGEVPASLWHEEATPKSERKPRERGTTHEELWRTLDEIDDELEDNELSGTARASLLGRKASTLDRISRLEERQKLDEHPDFEAFAEDALQALEMTLRHFGVSPDGARTVFAEHLERLETERQRRAA